NNGNLPSRKSDRQAFGAPISSQARFKADFAMCRVEDRRAGTVVCFMVIGSLSCWVYEKIYFLWWDLVGFSWFCSILAGLDEGRSPRAKSPRSIRLRRAYGGQAAHRDQDRHPFCSRV